jgi:hypothetical protein
MKVLDNYCKKKYNSIIISKITISSVKNYPELKYLFLYFTINTKQYKKNILLFYLIINLIFGGIKFTKKNSIGTLLVFKLSVKKKRMFLFLQSFVSCYLPLINTPENIYKQTTSLRKKSLFSLCFYRFNYFVFPAIPELDLMYEDFELLYDFITSFKLQLEIIIRHPKNVISSGETILRMHKLPCLARLKTRV